jgi:hypothetical protein
MTIPKIQKRLLEISAEIKKLNAEIRRLTIMLSRRRPIRRAKNSSRHVTPELAEEIRVFHAGHPTWPLSRIAKQFNVNGGRVSEVTRGYRT